MLSLSSYLTLATIPTASGSETKSTKSLNNKQPIIGQFKVENWIFQDQSFFTFVALIKKAFISGTMQMNVTILKDLIFLLFRNCTIHRKYYDLYFCAQFRYLGKIFRFYFVAPRLNSFLRFHWNNCETNVTVSNAL